MLKFKSVNSYLAFVFIIGFMLCLVGVTIEDINHGVSMVEALSEFHHYIAPFIMGVGISIIGYVLWKRNQLRLAAQSQLSKNENKYRTLFENMQDSVTMLDNNKRIIDANKSALELFEYTKDEMIGMSIDQFVYKEDKDISNTYFEKLDETGSYSMYEGRIVTKTGKIIWIQVNSTEFLEEGIKIGSQDIIRDINARKRIEIELQDTVRQLNELNTTKDKLFSIISHDLRSPFNSILGLSELLLMNLENSEDKKQKDALKNINSTARVTYDLLENLLNWAKSQTGQINYQPIRLRLQPIISDVAEMVLPSAQIKNITLDYKLADNIEVHADENMLRTIIRNLAYNAVKFTRNNGHINIDAHSNREGIEISVSDDGVGVDKNVKEKLFSIDSNISLPGTSNERGSGLGLVLCSEFVNKHKGRIWVESDGKRGSVFKFTLPFEQLS